MGRSFFHLHLVSDSTGETLLAVSRAASAQYQGISAIEHIYPLVRNSNQLDRVLQQIDLTPGIVLYTLVDRSIAERLEHACRESGCPCLSVLEPVHSLFQSYLGIGTTPRPGAQHMLNAEYFRRIDALNFTMMHDDGQLTDGIEQADVILVGVSRTSKTPTSIYLANRGIKTANVPMVPGIPLPDILSSLERPLIVGLVASPERIVQIRQNRLLSLNAGDDTAYVDRSSVAEELAYSRRLFDKYNWPIIDVSRRSIEETAAAILDLYHKRREQMIPE
ncbi:MAG TPA: pyruvate, water dikinase regulatory protein [Beijerinckiaceae bacterium]|nr:pyruvate, water dikinase regulatory protein [Beijerinckiaceae bacterium]